MVVRAVFPGYFRFSLSNLFLYRFCPSLRWDVGFAEDRPVLGWIARLSHWAWATAFPWLGPLAPFTGKRTRPMNYMGPTIITHQNLHFTQFQILNFSFLKILSCVTLLTIDKFKLKNYIKVKKNSLHVWSALLLLLLLFWRDYYYYYIV